MGINFTEKLSEDKIKEFIDFTNTNFSQLILIVQICQDYHFNCSNFGMENFVPSEWLKKKLCKLFPDKFEMYNDEIKGKIKADIKFKFNDGSSCFIEIKFESSDKENISTIPNVIKKYFRSNNSDLNKLVARYFFVLISNLSTNTGYWNLIDCGTSTILDTQHSTDFHNVTTLCQVEGNITPKKPISKNRKEIIFSNFYNEFELEIEQQPPMSDEEIKQHLQQKEPKTFDEPGRGRKQCNKCDKYVGVKIYECPCGNTEFPKPKPVKNKGVGKGKKMCPDCNEIIGASCKTCPKCELKAIVATRNKQK